MTEDFSFTNTFSIFFFLPEYSFHNTLTDRQMGTSLCQIRLLYKFKDVKVFGAAVQLFGSNSALKDAASHHNVMFPQILQR